MITKQKLKDNYEMVHFNYEIYNIYLEDLEKNKDFYVFLKANLIQEIFQANEIPEVLSFFSKNIKRNFVEILEIICKNYDKIKSLYIKEKKTINISDYITCSKDDNYEQIQNYFNFIVSERQKDNYELIIFNKNIWQFYASNDFDAKFLSFIESKLYENSLTSSDIFDSLEFSSLFRKKSFASMLIIILDNYVPIEKNLKVEQKNIRIFNYINPDVKDDMPQIYKLIKSIIEKEKENDSFVIKFDITIWEQYINIEDLDNFRILRDIILECKKVESELDPEILNLSEKIHNLGHLLIKNDNLNGDKLLNFVGKDEIFYIDKHVKFLYNTDSNLQKQIYEKEKQILEAKEEIKDKNSKIMNLKTEIDQLSNRLNKLNDTIKDLQNNNNNLSNKVGNLENTNEKLENDINELKKRLDNLN